MTVFEWFNDKKQMFVCIFRAGQVSGAEWRQKRKERKKDGRRKNG